MPLDLAAALRRHLLQRFPADRDYPRAALHADGMPPLIAAFLDRTLDRWVEIERAQIRSDWFDFESPEVQRAEEQFFDALARTARVPAEAWKGTLGGAVDIVVRFLTTPSRALTDAIFEGSADPLPADEVRARLSLFDAYPYFAEIAGAYLDRKQSDALEPPDLFGLLDRIDRRVVSEYGPDDWLALLAPLFGLARRVPELGGVPVPLLKRFFEMKGESDLAARVGKHTGAALNEAALRSLLAPAESGAKAEVTGAAPELPRANGQARPSRPEIEAPRDEAEAEEPEVDEPEAEEPEALAEVEEPDAKIAAQADDEPTYEHADADETNRTDTAKLAEFAEDESAEEAELAEDETSEEDVDDEAVPLWQRFARRDEDDNVNARYGNGIADATAGTATPASDLEAPLWKRFFARPDDRPSPLPGAPTGAPPVSGPPRGASLPERPARTPARADSLEDLERRVLGAATSGQRSRFVKHLFGGDAGKYATVLHTLDAAGSWTEASQIIARDVFRPFRINIYGEHAVAFTDAVESRYRR